MERIELLDVVELTEDLADTAIPAGTKGTALVELGGGAWEVEFTDDKGHTMDTAAVLPTQARVIYRHAEATGKSKAATAAAAAAR